MRYFEPRKQEVMGPGLAWEIEKTIKGSDLEDSYNRLADGNG